MLLAESEGVALGYITGRIRTEPDRVLPRRGIVEDWFVLPEARGAGVGAKLLHALESRFATAGCEVIESATWAGNTDARRAHAEATGQARWIDEARAVTETMLDHFWDPERGGLFTIADDAEPLVARQKDIVDNATPSANSLAALALYRLAALTGEQRYANHADRILHLIAGQLDERTSTMYVNVLLAAELRRRGFTEVVIVGDRPDLVRFAHRLWRPDTVLAWGEPYPSPLWDGRAPGYAYVCRDHACGLPQDTVEGLANELSGPDGTTRSNPGASPPRG